MALTTRKNQYRGINAHLHSYLQSKEGDWENFHFNHISDLNRAFMDVLVPLGYIASSQQSLQIRLGSGENRYPESDVTLYDPELERAIQPRSTAVSAANAYVMPLTSYVSIPSEEELFYRAIGIYPADKQKGQPVAWVELLSPSNKPRKSGYRQYAEKRLQVLLQGIVFIELDYLHETPATSHTRYQPSGNVYPYLISVSVPRPTLGEGKTLLYQFSVDNLLPVVTIPLSGSDQIDFNFGVPYHKTFHDLYYGNQVDYMQIPVSFNLYTEVDQLSILKRMLAVIEAKQQGQDLEAVAPLPVAYPDVSLDEAMQKLKSYHESSEV